MWTVFLILLLAVPSSLLQGADRIREPVFAGSWYPGEEEVLRKAVEEYMKEAACEIPPGRMIGLICPHAGYSYSGAVAGHSYHLVRGKQYEAVILVGPSHRYPFPGASVWSRGVWKSPVGDLTVDGELADAIVGHHDLIRDVERAHTREHSLELQLPFVHEALGTVPIVPIVMADQSYENSKLLADAIIRAVGDRNVLLIASSDLSHYHPGTVADRLDSLLIDRVEDLDVKGLLDGLRDGSFEACGGGPIATVLLASRELGAKSAHVLAHANSGDVTGDYDQVVGYLAAAVTTEKARTPRKPEKTPLPSPSGASLGDEEQAYLRAVVRETIDAALEGRTPVYGDCDSPVLREMHGAFVTLKIDGRLRGCMGRIVPTCSILDAVKALAVAAAFQDPRFEPLSKEEAERIEFEISILTPLTRIEDVDLIEVGTHGIFLRKGYRTGVLLPQVPVEQGWDREEFLQGICRKAGLPGTCCDDPGVELSVFSAQVF